MLERTKPFRQEKTEVPGGKTPQSKRKKKNKRSEGRTKYLKHNTIDTRIEKERRNGVRTLLPPPVGLGGRGGTSEEELGKTQRSAKGRSFEKCEHNQVRSDRRWETKVVVRSSGEKYTGKKNPLQNDHHMSRRRPRKRTGRKT